MLLELLKKIISTISPQLREYIKDMLTKMEAKAKETDNPLDDVLVLVLRILFNVQEDDQLPVEKDVAVISPRPA